MSKKAFYWLLELVFFTPPVMFWVGVVWWSFTRSILVLTLMFGNTERAFLQSMIIVLVCPFFSHIIRVKRLGAWR